MAHTLYMRDVTGLFLSRTPVLTCSRHDTARLRMGQRGGTGGGGRAKNKGEEKERKGNERKEQCHKSANPGKKPRDSWTNLDSLARTQLGEPHAALGSWMGAKASTERAMYKQGMLCVERASHRAIQTRVGDEGDMATGRSDPSRAHEAGAFLGLGLVKGGTVTMYLFVDRLAANSAGTQEDCTVSFLSCAERQRCRNSSPYAELNNVELE
ncbi:hypothetical protein B0H13DRAFT_1904812 [Mycena leptocephala]|nr:hypothetical protein B0H13DRAFT_1904812 [Mycena leptocephala]